MSTNRRFLIAVLLALACAGCRTMAGVTTLDDPACRATMTGAIADVLRSQGETERIDELASGTVAALPQLGPRPFLVMAQSGADYSFFVQRKDEACLLRLYAREKGFTSYVNDMNFIETRPLGGCECAG